MIFKKLLSLIDLKLIKFIAVGVVNTLLGTVMTFGLYNLAGLAYWPSSAISYAIASVVSFFLNKYFTFKSTARGYKQIIKFALNIAVCYLVAYGVAQPLVRTIFSNLSATVSDNIALLVGMVLFTGLNYLGQRLFVFKTNSE